MSKRESEPPTRGRSWRKALARRQSSLDSAIVAFPLFIIYQVGIWGSPTQNGADLLTRALITLIQSDGQLYLLLFAVASLTYLAVLWLLARTSNWNRKTVGLTLIESTLYALSLGSVITVMMRALGTLIPGLSTQAAPGGLSQVVIVACGAGVHEELVFRVLGVGVLSRLLSLQISRKTAVALAVIASSILFSLAHHMGSLGEAFSAQAFIFRTLAGLVFSLIYLTRGTGVAIWTHTLYDIYVMGILEPR